MCAEPLMGPHAALGRVLRVGGNSCCAENEREGSRKEAAVPSGGMAVTH